jgi:formylglycine-generating enzyme required for sulfatase activity
MRRNVCAAAGLVKQRPVAGSAAGWVLLLGAVLGCGGAPPAPRKVDLYGQRVSECIEQPRPLNDAAQARMRGVPAGPAVQGSTAQERAQARADFGPGAGPRLFEDEARIRRGYVHAFKLDPSPVTRELYLEFLQACGVIPPDAEAITPERWAEQQRRSPLRHAYADVQRFLLDRDVQRDPRKDHPMVLVSQDDAGFYCAWRGARLPSEEEWERAARGATGRTYPWGNRYDPFRVNTAQRGNHDTIEVGRLPQGNTEDGFTDLGGNVFEWTETPAGRPGFVVVKGNGWDGRGGFGRGAARLAVPADIKDVTLGFRCASD